MSGVQFPSGFNITTDEAVDARLVLTEAQMQVAHLNFAMPEYYFCLNKDDGRFYIYYYRDAEHCNEWSERYGYFKLAEQDVLEKFKQQIEELYSQDRELSGRIRLEAATARAAEAALNTALTNEINRAKQAEGALRSDLTTETAERQSADDELSRQLNAEIGSRKAGDNAEKAARELAVRTLTSRLAAEESTRASETSALSDGLAAETSAREQLAADTTTKITNLNSALSSEITRAKTAERTETDRAKAAENSLGGRLAAIESDYLTNADKRQLDNQIAQEVIDRASADDAIYEAIAAERARATQKEGELATAVDDEAQSRAQADATIRGELETEATTARAAEEALRVGKADKATTLAGYGITDAYTKSETDDLLDAKADKSNTYTKAEVYTKAETESAIDAKLQSTFRYKGSVLTYADLPTSGNETGDVWNIQTADAAHHIEAGDNVCWSGSFWDKFGGELAVDSAMNKDSTNPVQNKVIYEALQNSTKSGSAGTGWGPTTVKVGGIEAGTDMSNTSVLDILHDILYPYVAPKYLSVSLTPSTGIYLEKGAAVTVTKVSSSLTLGSKAITSYKLLQNGTEIESGSAVSSLEKTLDGVTFTEATAPTFSATATDGQTTLSASAPGYSWKFRIYYGVVSGSVTTPTETQLKHLSNVIEAKSSKTLTFDMAGQKCVLAYPSEYGDLTRIEDSNGFNVTSSFDKQTVTVTNINNVTTTYKVYTLSTPVTSNMTYKFMF